MEADAALQVSIKGKIRYLSHPDSPRQIFMIVGSGVLEG